MMTNEDIHAAVRLFAFALAGDYEQADELIQWAYKDNAKKFDKDDNTNYPTKS